MGRVNGLVLGFCLILPLAMPRVGMAAEPAPAAAPDAPDLELLEFLGEWGGEDEAWLTQQERLGDGKQAAAPQKAEVKKDE